MQSFSRMWITREEMEEYMSLARSRKDVSFKTKGKGGDHPGPPYLSTL
jgi:hypothetical protein